MKLIVAYVRPEQLSDVLEELFHAEVRGLTISRVQGHGGEMEHVATTGSAIGIRVLAEWHVRQQQFVVVMPRDFKRVKAAEARARAEAREPAFSDLVA